MSSTTTPELPDFSQGNAAASLATPAQASTLRKGSYILIRSHPCQISDLSTSKPGKHGSAKMKYTAYDILTHHKYEDLSPAHAMVEVPVVTKEYLVVDVDEEGFLSLLASGETREDLKVPEGEVGEKVRRLFGTGVGKDVVVVVVGSMGGEMVADVKEVDRE